MRVPENLGMILLAIYLIIEGVLRLTGGGIGLLMGLLAWPSFIIKKGGFCVVPDPLLIDALLHPAL